MRRENRYTIKGAWALIITLVILLLSLIYTESVSGKLQTSQLGLTEQSLRRYVVQCYALEGFYPGDLDYLCDNYSLHLNNEKYIYHYKYIADNIFPEIYVFERSGE